MSKLPLILILPKTSPSKPPVLGPRDVLLHFRLPRERPEFLEQFPVVSLQLCVLRQRPLDLRGPPHGHSGPCRPQPAAGQERHH